jgi:hypothetical protein
VEQTASGFPILTAQWTPAFFFLQGGAFFTFGNAVRTVILGFGVAHFVYDERIAARPLY